MSLSATLREYADLRHTSHELSRTLFRAADRNDELTGALREMLREFDDPSVTDELKTQMGLSANTVKALQRARAAVETD